MRLSEPAHVEDMGNCNVVSDPYNDLNVVPLCSIEESKVVKDVDGISSVRS